MNVEESAEVQCPYCGEFFVISVDTTHGSVVTTEDCAVCCNPVALRIECKPGEVLSVAASIG